MFDAMIIEIDGGEANCVGLGSSSVEVRFEVCRHTGTNQRLKQPDKMWKYFLEFASLGVVTGALFMKLIRETF